MVWYVILRRLLHEIQTLVSFRNTRFSAWFTLPEGYLRGVKLPSPEPWSPNLKPAQFDDDASTIALEDSYLELRSDDENDDWPDDDDVNDNAPYGDPSYHHTNPPSQPPSQHNIGHIEPGPPRPSDTCPHTCAVFNQNVNGLGGQREDNLKKIISLMIENHISAYCLQETWQLCYYMPTIRSYSLFHHGMMEKPQRQGQTGGEVMIILNPALTQAWARAGKLKTITSPPPSKFPGKMIGLTLSSPKLNLPTGTYHWRAKDLIKIFLCSIYHPYDFDEQKEFYYELEQFITNRPRNAEILMGAHINCNVGITSNRFSNTLGPHGIGNRNNKGWELIYLYKTNNLKLLLSYFKHHNYITYRSFI